MNTKFLWQLTRALRKVWVRVISYALLAVLAVSIAPLLPRDLAATLGGRLGSVSIDQILSILASSMLAVTTFSLSIAVSAFSAASAATPRASALLQQDTTTQNVLATFLGAFLFGLIGLMALSTDFYNESGEVFLLLASLVVVALVIVALLRWIAHLMSFGRLGDTLNRVERAATQSLQQRLANPWLGGQPLQDPAPQDALAVRADQTGYVQHIDIGALARCAEELDGEFYLAALPGSFVHPAAELLRLRAADCSEEQQATIRNAFSIGQERSFDQDPRFGLIVLSEIASRAASPAVNDPGTAISVIGRLVRVLAALAEGHDADLSYPRIHVPPLYPADLLLDAFRPIAHDGAANFEVQIRLQKALYALGEIAPDAFGDSSAELAAYARKKAAAAGLDPSMLKPDAEGHSPARAKLAAAQDGSEGL